ncbi:hypothetical protein VNO77_12602 [Canavalia gladiata]|uniref:Uncharacterized protein n=1 Tax=Canavalia gladiata TaxID=3824 RepID=A0AAN9LWX3_CANGL
MLRCEHRKKIDYIKDNYFEIIGCSQHWQRKKKDKFATYATISKTKKRKNLKEKLVNIKSQLISLLFSSINKLTTELNCLAVFLPHDCFGHDLTTKRVIETGKLQGNLYFLDQEAEV